jgi:alanyl-tRNA synthetase
MTLDESEYSHELNAQKERSRDDAAVSAGDWHVVSDADKTIFTGYTRLEDSVRITRYRKVIARGNETIQLVFDRTPFYAESGGQTGDRGYISNDDEKILITDTIKENNLIIHIAGRVPSDPSKPFRAVVDGEARQQTACNHTATHLMHYALRQELGKHVEQKGSLVTPDKLRFDFSHFRQVTREELAAVELKVNEMIMQNIVSGVSDDIPLEKALEMGAMALFGEKYGEKVRVVTFGDSIELCGGTHVKSTSAIGIFKIISESAVAAGIRRIEAVTGRRALDYINKKLQTLDEITTMLKSTGNPSANVSKLMSENASLKHTIEKMHLAAANNAIMKLADNAEKTGKFTIYSGVIDNITHDTLKQIAHQIRQSDRSGIVIIGSENEGRASLLAGLGEEVTGNTKLNAVEIIKAVAGDINGGG